MTDFLMVLAYFAVLVASGGFWVFFFTKREVTKMDTRPGPWEDYQNTPPEVREAQLLAQYAYNAANPTAN
jgi:hypothetical protein